MRSLYESNNGLAAQLVPVCAAYVLVGLSFGAVSASSGVPAYAPIVSSLTVFAGSAQFAALGIMLGGGGCVVASLVGLVINARLMGYGFAVSPVFRGQGIRSLLLGHLLTDVNTALALQRRDSVWRRRALWRGGLSVFAVWNVSTWAGVVVGQHLADMRVLGLDAVLPAILLGLVRSALSDRSTRRACGLGAVVVLVSQPWLAPGVPVLLSLVGMLSLAWPGYGAGHNA